MGLEQRIKILQQAVKSLDEQMDRRNYDTRLTYAEYLELVAPLERKCDKIQAEIDMIQRGNIE